MNKLFLLIVVGLMILSIPAHTEQKNYDYEYAFDEEGYSGSWITLDELEVEFCLPEGWEEAEKGEGIAFAARRGDERAWITIRLAAEDVEALSAWAEGNLEAWTLEETDFSEAAVVEKEEAIEVYLPLKGGRLMAFDFSRADRQALSVRQALQIAGTLYEEWMP